MTATRAAHTQKRVPRPLRRREMRPVAGSEVAALVVPVATAMAVPGTSATVARPSGTTHPGVEEGEEEVHREVHDHEGHRGHEGHALDHEIVTGVDGLDELVADARELEEDLDDEGPGEQRPDG